MRLELLGKLLELTKQQEEEINNEEVEKYIELIDQRQLIMEKIDQLNSSNPQVLSDEERQILMEIKRIDDQNNEEFMRQFEEVKGKLRQLRNNMQTSNYYNNGYSVTQEEGLFIDKRNGIMKNRRR